MAIDWARVRELRDEIGAEDFDEVAALFLDEVSQAVSALSSDATLSDVESALHFIKGSALNLGFAGLAQLCGQGEAEAASGSQPSNTPQSVQDRFEAELAEFNAGRLDLAS